MRQLLIVLITFCLPLLVQAKEAEYVGGNPEIHDRVMSVAGELRCLVCQGQSLADSNSSFARDMRDYIKDMMVEKNMSDQQVIDFMVERYGDTVSYRPPVKGTTYLLWFSPFILLIVGLIILGVNVLRRRSQIQEVPLSEEEHRRAVELLKEESEEGKA